MDPFVEASLDAYGGPDEEFVERAFREVLRRPADDGVEDARLGMLADGTLSRATFLHELVTAAEATRVRELDDAVALGLGARARGERLAWLQAPGGTDERVIEIPWVLSRLVESGRVLEVGYAYAEAAYLAGLLRAGIELVGVDLAERDVEGMERVTADVRSLPLPDGSVDQVLLVSTLEHVGADNTGYGLDAEDDPGSRADALRELRRVLAPKGSLLVTVPLGEPGDHGWFRLDDVDGWNDALRVGRVLRGGAGGIRADRRRLARGAAFHAPGVGYGDRGPAASAVLCTELSPGPSPSAGDPATAWPARREASDSRAPASRLSVCARRGPRLPPWTSPSPTSSGRSRRSHARSPTPRSRRTPRTGTASTGSHASSSRSSAGSA